MIQRSDCDAFAPCHAKDPAYGRAVVEAHRHGVLLIPLQCTIDAGQASISFVEEVPIDLEHGIAKHASAVAQDAL